MYEVIDRRTGLRTGSVRLRLVALAVCAAALASVGLAFAASSAHALRWTWSCNVASDTRCFTGASGEVHGWKNVRVQLTNGQVAASTIHAKAISGSTVRGYAEASGGYGAARLARACITPVDPATFAYTYWTGSAVHSLLGPIGAVNLDSAAASPSDSAGVCGL